MRGLFSFRLLMELQNYGRLRGDVMVTMLGNEVELYASAEEDEEKLKLKTCRGVAI